MLLSHVGVDPPPEAGNSYARWLWEIAVIGICMPCARKELPSDDLCLQPDYYNVNLCTFCAIDSHIESFSYFGAFFAKRARMLKNNKMTT